MSTLFKFLCLAQILVTLNANYLKPLKVMLTSLFLNNPNEHFAVYLMHSSMSDRDIEEVGRLADLFPLVIIIHQLPELKIRYMSNHGLRLIGKTWDDVDRMSYQEFMDTYFNPEHFQETSDRIVGLLSSDVHDDFISYFQQVRTSQTREWDWYLNTSKVLLRDQNYQPVLLITTAMRINPEDDFISKAARLLEENAFIKNNYSSFASLGPREKEVLKLLALGKTASEIGDMLSISVATAETHRKNIKKKLGTGNIYELSMYARAFDLI